MGRHRLPCDDPVLSAKREKARERTIRNARRRRETEATAPRVTGAVVFAPVTCPRCEDTFRGLHPLHSYSKHRASEHCPWFDETEKAAHKALVRVRNIALATHHTRLVRESAPTVQDEPLPALHTGHELFDRARAARRSWPRPTDFLSWPIWEDIMSEAVLALLEGRDPAEAIREFVRKEPPRMLSLYSPAPWAPDRTLLDVLAA